MALYKNGVEYGMSFHLDGGGSGTPPNTLENMTKSRTAYLNCDDTWLPYFGNSNGNYLIGAKHNPDNGDASMIWDVFKEIWLDFDKPIEIGPISAGETYSFANAEQIYLKNAAQQSGTPIEHGSDTYANNCRFFTLFDEDSTHNTWDLYLTHIGSNLPESTVVAWVPNGSLVLEDTNATTAVIAANSLRSILYNSSNYKVIYINQSLYNDLQNDYNWMNYGWNDQAVYYDLSATEWLDNYFTIVQDGDTIPWYQESVENYFGKYIRLKSNNTVIAEVPYWKTQDLVTTFPANLTSSAVTRTGTVTVGQITKSYSITQNPCERTISARVYFNTENGTYTKFSIWPFYDYSEIVYAIDLPDRGDSARGQLTYNQIKAIRYKPANGSTWSTLTLPDFFDMVRLAQTTQYICTYQNLFLDISTTGYYDIQWILIYDTRENAHAVNYDGTINTSAQNMNDGNSIFCLRNFKVSSDYVTSSTDADVNDQNTPWIISVDGGAQVFDRSQTIKNQLDTTMNYLNLGGAERQYVQTVGFHDYAAVPYWFTPYYEYVRDVVVDNTYTASGFPGFGTFGWTASAGGNWLTVWYANDKRVPCEWNFIAGFDNQTVRTLYLNPTIYNMTNHGFNDEVGGWSQQALSDFELNGGHVYELPSDWKTRVPNYVGV